MDWQGNNMVFRTYVKGSGKRSVEKHKNIKHVRTFEDASQFESFGAVLNDGFIDISFDSEDMSERFLDMADANDWKCLVLRNPINGHVHSYWRNKKIKKNGVDKKLACGLIADIHSGGTYIPLRVDKVDRFPPEYDIFEGERYDYVPDELMPILTDIKIYDMDDGEGRNATLFKYILVLQNQLKLTKDVIRRVLNNTNQYVFSEPLDQYEMETILRDESFEKPSFFDEKKRFMHDQFAEFMCDRMNVVKINGQLHIYEDGIYVSGYKKIESEMIKIIPQLKNNQRKEVLAYLELIAEEKTTSDARYIGFANGIYDVVTDSMMDFSPEIVITNMLPWEYNKEAYNELADHTLNRLACDDHQIRLLLEECIGYCMYRRNELGKAFILTGDKSNGKSTFLDVLKVLLGEENISALDLAELGDRFSTAMMYNRLANIGDDIGDDFMQGNQVATFKKIVTGNRIKAERKGQDPFDFNPYVKLLFAANDIPRMRDKSGAVLRRLVIIPFNAKFTKQDPDYRPFIKYELEEQSSIEYLIKLGVDGLRRVLENSAFTESDSVNQQLSEYEEENNPILGFIKDNDRASIVNQSTTDVYARYMMFCNDSGMNPMSKVVFIKNINKRMNICVKRARINGKSIKIFSEV